MLALKRTQGYTLQELLVTLAIVAIIAAFATPSFQNMIANQNVRAATGDLISALNFARSEAVKRNRVVTVSPGASWAAGWAITFVDENGATQTLRQHDGFDGVTAAGNTAISFRADGRRNSANVNIEITPPTTSGASKHCVGVSPTGKPESKAGAC